MSRSTWCPQSKSFPIPTTRNMKAHWRRLYGRDENGKLRQVPLQHAKPSAAASCSRWFDHGYRVQFCVALGSRQAVHRSAYIAVSNACLIAMRLPTSGPVILLLRVRSAGAKILSSATSVDEARWLEDQGCDAIIAQGVEAGGHRGMFLTEDVSTQVGTMALVPQVVDVVKVPVIAAGGISDARGILAAFALGASAVQIGTGYLHCPEAKISPLHRQALKDTKDDQTAITNVFTGRPARAIVNRIMREVGPMSDVAPEFPLAAVALTPLRAKSELAGSVDFTPLWSGQAARLSRALPAAELTKQLAAEALGNLGSLQTMACGA